MTKSPDCHVAFVSFSGLRVREQELFEIGITLPGLEKRKDAVAALPALGLLTLAGRMPAGWTCSYHEIEKWNDSIVEQIVAENPALVAISALTASIREAYSFCDALRTRGVATSVGGLHVSACPNEAVQHADAVVVGDGEALWERLLEDSVAGNLRGIYRGEQPFDLRNSKLPRFDLAATSPRSRFTIQTQRGCPMACEFCAGSRILGGLREKPVNLLSRELALLNSLVPQPTVELADDNTFAGTRDQRALLQVLADAHVRYFTETDWRIGEQPDLLRDLAASGCLQVLVGIESLVYEYMGLRGKRAELPRIIAALDAIQDHGIAVVGCFVLGADGETLASIASLSEFLLNCRLADVQVTLQTPFPGTPLRERLLKAGRLIAGRGWDYYTLFDLTFIPDSISVRELEIAYRQLAGQVYSASENHRRLGIRRRIWEKSHTYRQRGIQSEVAPS